MRRTSSWINAAAFALLATTSGPVLTGDIRTDDLKPYPPAAPGVLRWVIRLPAVPVPEERKVEVMVGKTIEVDCNRRFYSATVSRQIAQGWGYPYYVVSELKGSATTLMACPSDFVKRKEFVRANAEVLAALAYNAKLPIVIYAPVGAEVRYRVWTAGDTTIMDKPE
jgi:ecotin